MKAYKCDRYGHWIDRGVLNDYPHPDVNVYHALQCSECGALHLTRPYCEGGWINANWCPNCGAHMNDERNEETQEPPSTVDEESEKSFKIEVGDAGYVDRINTKEG